MQVPPFVTDDRLTDLIDRALEEDVGTGDVTTEATIGAETRAEATFLAKQDGILAGRHVAERILERVDPDVAFEWTRADGQAIFRGTAFGTIKGRARSILSTERLVLNVMQRMSGIATAAHAFVEAVRGYDVKILDTRKTAPGLRMLDKWAVRLGGGENHRIGLYDMILIKDNHIAAAGGIAEAIDAAVRFRADRDLDIEIETRTLDEVRAVLEDGRSDMILLDNMVNFGPSQKPDVSTLRDAVELIGGRMPTEASGNVTRTTVRAIAATGVDFISCGVLTHSVSALDISLQMQLEGRHR